MRDASTCSSIWHFCTSLHLYHTTELLAHLVIGLPPSPWLDYSSSIPVIVIVIVALAEELLALLTLLATSLLGTLVSATETSLSFKPIRIDATRRTARVAMMTNLFTSTSS